MYTEDDKKSKRSNYDNYDYNDYYADYYGDYQNDEYKPINNIDTSYTDDYSNGEYKVSTMNVNRKKYTIIIIVLSIILIILGIILYKTIMVKNIKPETNTYIKFFKDEVEIKIGEEKKLDLILSNQHKKNYRIEWFSNNDNVVSVDNNGNIVGVNEGDAIILVAYYLGDKVFDAQCHIYVLK